MYDKEAEKTEPAYDDTYLRGRIDKLNKQVRMIVAILIDKGLIGEELGKRIEESKQGDDKELLKWLFNEIDKKK